jgi:hypothetical protein
MEDLINKGEATLYRGSRENKAAAHRDLPRLQVPAKKKEPNKKASW